MRIEPIYSRDDGGWYAEVVDPSTGKTLYTTEIYPSRGYAIRAAKRWIEYQLAKEKPQ